MSDVKGGGGRVKIVKKRLADGTIREYRYDLDAAARRKFIARRSDAIHQLATAYYASPEFARLAPRYQRDKRQRLSIAADFLGWMTFDDLANRKARAEFYRLRDAHADRPPTADHITGALAHLLAWAYERGLIEHNHALRLETIAPRSTRAERVWTDDDIAAYLAVAREDVARLFLAALYTAARQGDLCAMRASDLRDGWLTYRPQKTSRSTGVVVHLPTHELAPLRELLADAPREGPLWPMQDGRPWRVNGVQHAHARTLARAGLDGLRWHDLRGTAASRMLAAGATDAQVAAITGHTLASGSALSAYLARSRDLAVAAYRAWDRSMRPAEVVSIRGGNRGGTGR
jgi:integrase